MDDSQELGALIDQGRQSRQSAIALAALVLTGKQPKEQRRLARLIFRRSGLPLPKSGGGDRSRQKT
jgi:hypothetical protein